MCPRPRRGRIAFAAVVALLCADTCSAAAAAPRWKFTITGSSTTTFDYGDDRKRICDPDEGGLPTIGAARYENTINGTATVREHRYAASRSGWAFWKPARINGTVRQSATEIWDEHPVGCAPGTPSTERTCSTGVRTSRLNRNLHQLHLSSIGSYGTDSSTIGIGHRDGREGLTFPSLTTHCNADLFDWLDERTYTNFFAGRKVSPRHWRKRRGRLVLTPTSAYTRSPYYPNTWGTVDFRVTLTWRRVGGPVHDHRLCPRRGCPGR
jgi:hypothetical protein